MDRLALAVVALGAAAAVAAVSYNAWIIFRVVDDWLGLVAAIASIVVLPVSFVIMPFAMLLIPTSEAGPFALWPAILLIGLLKWTADKAGIIS